MTSSSILHATDMVSGPHPGERDLVIEPPHPKDVHGANEGDHHEVEDGWESKCEDLLVELSICYIL